MTTKDLISRDVGAFALPEAWAFRGAEVTSARTGKGMLRHENPIANEVSHSRIPIDGPACPPRDIALRLDARIDPAARQRVLLAWVLDGWKWKRDRRRQGRRPVWCAVDVNVDTGAR